MPYGDYDGPNKPDKGLEGGSCNRTLCQDPQANWFNHGSRSWYCRSCMRQIGLDTFNWRDWQLNHQEQLGHAMFETRAEITARNLRESTA